MYVYEIYPTNEILPVRLQSIYIFLRATALCLTFYYYLHINFIGK